MGAGFQGYPGRGAAQLVAQGPGITQCHHLGVRATCFLCRSAAEQPAVGAAEDAADARVGIAETERSFGELQRLLQALAVQRRQGHVRTAGRPIK